MKKLISMVVFLFIGTTAHSQSTDDSAQKFQGAYLVTQSNDVQRVLAFAMGGTVSMVGAGEQRGGYTSGLGNWRQSSPNQVVARIVNFNFDRESGAPIGAALNVYTLEFDELEDGRFQSVSGSFAGQQFEMGQNPLDPAADPVRTFGRDVSGKRIAGE